MSYTVRAVGCDDTNVHVNSSAIGGVIRLVDRCSYWLICLLHAHELLLRYLMHKLDGGKKDQMDILASLAKLLSNISGAVS